MRLFGRTYKVIRRQPKIALGRLKTNILANQRKRNALT